MDDSLYDEFGNFIGTVESDVESEGGQDDLDARADVYLQDDEEEDVAEEQLMEVDGTKQMNQRLNTETPTNAIILHEDKQYYPSASQVFGPDVEVLVQEEDTQPLTEPIVAPLKVKSFAVEEKDLPPVNYSRAYMAQLTHFPEAVRNIALVGQLHHGKTGLIDLFVNETHVLPPIRQTKDDNRLRYTDTHVLERARGISIKSAPITLLLPNQKGKSYAFNFIDTPGHVNFSDEVAAAIRLVDGIVLVVDVVEGVMANTDKILRHAIAEGQHIVLVLNKMDRLILELKIPPQDAYYKLRHTIEEVNTIIASCGSTQRLSPELGNVVFSSAAEGWSFTLASFARLYGELSGTRSWDESGFAQRLWGDIFYNPSTRKFQRKQRDTEATRGFVHFILEPLYKLYAQTIGEDAPTLKKTLKSLGISLKDNLYKLDSRDLLRIVCHAFFGTCGGFVDAMITHIPNPLENAKNKTERTYTGPMNSSIAGSLSTCNPDGPLIVQVTKLYSSSDARTFQAFGRVMSGTMRKGDIVRVLGEEYSLDNEEQSEDETVGDLFLSGGRYRVAVNEVPAGNLVLFDGVDKSIFKTATIVTKSLEEDAYIFRPLSHFTQSVFKLAIEPTNPSDLPKMTSGLRSVNKSYQLLETRIEESGEHVLLGTGEIFLDCVLHDLRVLYAEIDIKVSDPVVRFCETVVETSALKCYAETPNKKYLDSHHNSN
jgi:U5 small nuclear ribonucleoprotein component